MFSRYPRVIDVTLLRQNAARRCRLVWFSKRINKSISCKFSIHGLGQLIYRTRLKMAAYMLNFNEYGDFADYFGPRWHYYLGDYCEYSDTLRVRAGLFSKRNCGKSAAPIRR